MTLRTTTRNILALTEETSGFPVVVEEDENLSTISLVKLARGNMAGHVVYYRPLHGLAPDYQISYQCGFIIRQFSLPPEERVDFVFGHKGEKETLEILNAPNGLVPTGQLAPEQAPAFAKKLADSLLLHFRSIPIGLRVGDWLWKHYPDLRESQQQVMLTELEQARFALNPDILKTIPERITLPTLALSGAQALYWSEAFAQPTLFNPYHLYGYSAPAQKLMDVFFETPDDPLHDRRLIDAWAALLKLSDWYLWKPYQTPFTT